MGAHESPAQTLAAVEADAIRLHAARLHRRALELVSEMDGLLELESCITDPETWRRAVMSWAGSASVILADSAAVLAEVARG